MGILYCGDCLEVMEKKLEAESVDLVYLDPPFFSNRSYEVIWGDEAEIRSFEDRWEGGIEVYSDWMAERLRACHRVLKPTGSLYLHCDWHAVHHLRLRLDEIFGREKFRNEIVWKRADTVKGNFGQGSKFFDRNTDSILFFAKSENQKFYQQFKPYSQEYIDGFYKYVEEGTGRRYRLISMTGPGGAAKGNPEYEVMGVRRYWRYSEEKMRALIASGMVVQTRPGTVPQRKLYLDEGRGVPTQSLWDDITALHSQSGERLGYPTQKPLALLVRIIAASSDEGDVVMDPFCGCGTALVVAQQMKRKWIGIDISPTAIRVVKQRLSQAGASSVETLGLPSTLDELKALKPFEFQNWVVRERFNGTVGKKGGDKGIDGYTFMVHEPIQVKQSEGVGRNVIDNFHAAMTRIGKKRGYIVAFSFGKGAHEEAAALKHREGLEIILVTCEELLSTKWGQ